MLNSEHMAPYPEWMEHVPYPPSYQIPNFFRFNAGDDALAYFVYFQQECGVRAAIEALCCKLFRYSLMGRTPIWYDYFAWGSIPIRELWCFLQELGALKIPNHEWGDSDDDWDFQSEQDKTDGSHTSSVSGDVGSAAPDGWTSEVDEFFEGRV